MSKTGDANWRDRMVERHANLYCPVQGGGIPGYPKVGDGWEDLLDCAAVRITAALTGEQAWASFRIVEINQKFGTLRLYFDGTKLSKEALAKIALAVELAEARSACTCETCGAEGRLYECRDWYSTKCIDHADGNAVHIRPGHKNLYVEQIFESGKKPVWSCRRYDRATDAFVDAPLPSDFKEAEGG